jgi:hypothetical protein
MRISIYYDLKCSIFPGKAKMFKGRVSENGRPVSDRLRDFLRKVIHKKKPL